MSKVLSDECINSGTYIKMLTGYEPQTPIIDWSEYNRLSKIYPTLIEHWDYPVSEIDHISEANLTVVLVMFNNDTDGGLIFRYCEIEEELFKAS